MFENSGFTMNETQIVRRVTPADNQVDMPDTSGVLMLRTRSLRWTIIPPKRAGWYWVRPKEYRFNTSIQYVPQAVPGTQFPDVEFSDRAISRPLEALAEDDTVMHQMGVFSTYATRDTDVQEDETEISRMNWFLGGLIVGVALGVAAMAALYFAMMNH